MGHVAAQQLESAHIYDDVPPVVVDLCDEPRPPMLTDDKVRVDRFQPCSRTS